MMRRVVRLLFLATGVAALSLLLLSNDAGSQTSGRRLNSKSDLHFPNTTNETSHLVDRNLTAIDYYPTKEQVKNTKLIVISNSYTNQRHANGRNYDISSESINVGALLYKSGSKYFNIESVLTVADNEQTSPSYINGDTAPPDDNGGSLLYSTSTEGLFPPIPAPKPPVSYEKLPPRINPSKYPKIAKSLNYPETDSTNIKFSKSTPYEIRFKSLTSPNYSDTSIFSKQLPFPRPTREPRDIDRFDPPLLIPQRPTTVSRVESPHYPWGSHTFGPLEAYRVAPLGMRWNAYFYEQSIAVVLEDRARNIINCTLLEVIPKAEMQVALRTLGQVMALVPVALRQMVLLNGHCFSREERDRPKPQEKRRTLGKAKVLPETLLLHATTALMGILPGTVWCGLGDRARVYHQLGARVELDECCREHDHCPVKLRAGATRYGVTNDAFSTISHCHCDQAFLACLKGASRYDDLAPIVGNLFFNILRPRCLAQSKTKMHTNDTSNPTTAQTRPITKAASASAIYRPRLHCAVYHAPDSGCRLWVPDPRGRPAQLVIMQPNFTFAAP